MIVGDRTYITGWDAEATVDPTTGLPTSPYSPLNADGTTNTNFQYDSSADAPVLFTSTDDNAATTAYYNPLTGKSTIIVPAINVLNTPAGTTPTPGSWGGISYTSGSYGVFNDATVQYAGGTTNIPGGAYTHDALAFENATGDTFGFNFRTGFQVIPGGFGTRVMVTNNNFYYNNGAGTEAPISDTPDGFIAGNTLTPLSSGAPFFRGNILQNNGFNALEVVGLSYSAGNQGVFNDDVNSLWDSTDITYLLRGTVVMGPGGGIYTPPVVSGTSFSTEPKPDVLLTVQSALAGTLEPNGQSIPKPGESVIIKLDNNGTAVPPSSFYQTPNIGSSDFGGAGFESGWDNGVDPTADPYVDQGAGSQIRFLGIGGNQTTGQSRVPVVITSYLDDTVGSTVRGVTMDQVVPNATQAPAAGDGGLILFGGNELPNYNILDPRAGSLIDNIDIRYITGIQMQGGGIITYQDLNASNSFDALDNPYNVKTGVYPPLANGEPNPADYPIQANTEHALMISNSNLSTFTDPAIIEHPGYDALAFEYVPGSSNQITFPTRSGIAGEPNLLFLVNDTIANSPIAVQVIGDPHSDIDFPEPNELVALNDTFYNNPIAFDLQAIVYDPGTPQVFAAIQFVGMDNIIDGSTTAIVQGAGMIYQSELQYNLFFDDGPVVLQNPAGPAISTGLGGVQQVGNITGNPEFRDPTTGNFQLNSNSAAIDASRSELNLNPDTGPINVSGPFFSNTVTALLPVVTQDLNASGGTRNQTGRIPLFLGLNGNGLDPNNPPTDELTLPGYPDRGFDDQFVAVLPSNPAAIPGPDTTAGTWEYAPIGGERDQLGYLRVDDPAVPNTGFGSRPFFDIGAYEYVNFEFNPPTVTAVHATIDDTATPTGTQTVNLYKAGGISGTNEQIQTIAVSFDRNVDPSTLTGATILLQGSGGDGIFGNNNSPSDKFYNLSGKTTWDAATNQLIINLGAAGLTLPNDEYRITLLGTGSNVIADPQGDALDGYNTLNDDPNNPQLPLPSGNGFPGE